MKKIMFFVAAFMAVSFAACGGSNNDGKSKEPVNKEQTVKDSLNKVAAKAAEDAANKAAEGVEASKKAAKEIGEAAKEKATEVTNAAVDAAKQAIDDAAEAAKKQIDKK